MLRPAVQSIKIALIIVLAAVVLVGVRNAFTYAISRESPPARNRLISFAVTKDDTASTVASRLAQARLIRSALLFRLQMDVARDDLQPGTYELRPGMSIPSIMAVLTGHAVIATPVPSATPSLGTPATTGILRILTVDATTQHPLAGVCYTLQSHGTVFCDNANGDTDPQAGVLLVMGLPPGSWTLTQTRPPAGYDAAGPAQIEIEAGTAPSAVTITDWPTTISTSPTVQATAPAAPTIGTLVIKTVDAQTGEALHGACYELRDTGPSYCDSGSGVVSLNDVVTGERTVTQTTSPAGYMLASPVQVQVQPGTTPATVTIKAQPLSQTGTQPTSTAIPALPTIQPVGFTGVPD